MRGLRRRPKPVVIELTNGLGMFELHGYSVRISLVPGQVAHVDTTIQTRTHQMDEDGKCRHSWADTTVPTKIRLAP
jgi:hypothetical protein